MSAEEERQGRGVSKIKRVGSGKVHLGVVSERSGGTCVSNIFLPRRKARRTGKGNAIPVRVKQGFHKRFGAMGGHFGFDGVPQRTESLLVMVQIEHAFAGFVVNEEATSRWIGPSGLDFDGE